MNFKKKYFEIMGILYLCWELINKSIGVLFILLV